MELRTWTPFFDLDKDWRFFDFPRMARELTGLEFRPSIDVVREEEELVVTAELPGIEPDDIDVSLDNGILTIKGEKSERKEITEDDRYLRERSYGKFLRRITLPEGIETDTMKATYDNGVLVIRVAVPEEKVDEPRHIPVEVNAKS
jgi:HSP20 family protein